MRTTLLAFIFLVLGHDVMAKEEACSLPEYDEYVKKIVRNAVDAEKSKNTAIRTNEIKMLAKRSISFEITSTPTRASFGNFFILDLRIENNLPISIQADPKNISINLPVNSIEDGASDASINNNKNAEACVSDDKKPIQLSTGHDAVLRWKCSPGSSIHDFFLDRPEMEQSVKIDGSIDMAPNDKFTQTQDNKSNLSYQFSFTRKIKFETPLVWTLIGAAVGGLLSILWQYFHENTDHKSSDMPLNKRIAQFLATRSAAYYFMKSTARILFSTFLVLLIDMSSSGFLFVNIKLLGIFGAALAGFFICHTLRDSNLEKVKHLLGSN